MKKVKVHYNQKLIDAAAIGDLNKVKEAINAGADVNGRSKQAIRWAIINGYLDIVKYLVSEGASINDGFLKWIKEDSRLCDKHEIIDFLKLCHKKKDDKLSKGLIKIILRNV